MPEMLNHRAYEPEVCPNKSCLGYGDTVPALGIRGRCFLCHTALVHYTEIPYDDIDVFVRKALEYHQRILETS